MKTEKDKFGNFTTDEAKCPRCGADVTYVAQWDSFMCAIDQCQWSELGGLNGAPNEEIVLPKRWSDE